MMQQVLKRVLLFLYLVVVFAVVFDEINLKFECHPEVTRRHMSYKNLWCTRTYTLRAHCLSGEKKKKKKNEIIYVHQIHNSEVITTKKLSEQITVRTAMKTWRAHNRDEQLKRTQNKRFIPLKKKEYKKHLGRKIDGCKELKGNHHVICKQKHIESTHAEEKKKKSINNNNKKQQQHRRSTHIFEA